MRSRAFVVMRGLVRTVLAVVVFLAGPLSRAQAQPAAGRPISDMTLEELATIEVTSVSRRPESLGEAPAAIFVITAEDIRRSGVTTLAEALRLAPNLQVARIDAGQYAITARGFNGLAANKLLVQVDGRTIYTPLFSGVFWDQQDVMIEDVERIEIISGPGATLWGANAVNGVINVITRSALDTHGLLAIVGGGNRQQGGAFRYGGTIGTTGGHFRAYGKFTNFEHAWRADGSPVRDARTWLQAGFRTDWGGADGGVTIQGDAYRVQSEDRGVASGIAIGRAELSGMNLLARWTRHVSGSRLDVQVYGDYAERNELILFQPRSTLFDVELQHTIPRGRHYITWGTGYRYGTDDVRDGFLVGFRPTARDLHWSNIFGQDRIRVTEQLELTAGIRLDRNDYTGWEYQPDARLTWKAAPDQIIWGAVSRAIRAPARFDRDVIRPAGGVFGGPTFMSEIADVVQVGYRARTANVLTWSVTAFHHEWDQLRSATAPPVFLENKIYGPAWGLEAWATWQALSVWRIGAGLTLLRKDLRLRPDSTDQLGPRNPQLANDPDEQWIVRSSINPWTDHEFDVVVRRVSELPTPLVPAYIAVDVRYAWRMHPRLQLALVGQNLLDRRHPEFNALPGRSEFERGISLQARWSP